MNDTNYPHAEKLRAWLTRAVEAGASDLHLIVGYPPVLRVHGDLIELPEPKLGPDEPRDVLAFGPAEAAARLRDGKNLDFSFSQVTAGKLSRFRANLFYAGGRVAACLRLVPTAIPNFAWAGFPPELADRLSSVRDGLVIVTGVSGSGKSTTLAMLVNLLNQTGGYRIITVEEPVEYVFPHAINSVVTQPRALSVGLLVYWRHEQLRWPRAFACSNADRELRTSIPLIPLKNPPPDPLLLRSPGGGLFHIARL